MNDGMLGIVTGCLLGFVLGMRHALEPDHLVAVSTFFTGGKPSKAVQIGLLWGLGHSLTLFAVGSVLTILDAQMPRRLGDLLEFGVGMMLIALGVRAVLRARRQGEAGPITTHSHGERDHAHAAAASHVHVGRWTFASGPLAVGLLHGLAGSGWLTALVLASLPSLPTRLMYIALFGVGSTAGMALLSGLMGWPIARLSAGRSFNPYIRQLGGVLSVVVGLVVACPMLLHLF